MLDIAIPDGPVQALEWPEGCLVDPATRAAVERDWQDSRAPQQQRRDELAELRATVASLQQEVRNLRTTLDKLGAAHNRSISNLGEAVDGLNLMMFGEPETLPKSKEEIASFTPHIVKLIRGHACTKEIGNRIAVLEARPVYKFVGTFTEGTEYEVGNITVRSGGSWICTENTKDIPGKSPCWAQLSRAGRDGRDHVVREPVLK